MPRPKEYKDGCVLTAMQKLCRCGNVIAMTPESWADLDAGETVVCEICYATLESMAKVEPDYVSDARNDMLKQGYTLEQAQEIIDILLGKVAYEGTIPEIVKEIVADSRKMDN